MPEAEAYEVRDLNKYDEFRREVATPVRTDATPCMVWGAHGRVILCVTEARDRDWIVAAINQAALRDEYVETLLERIGDLEVKVEDLEAEIETIQDRE